jgi:hypothetical protein
MRFYNLKTPLIESKPTSKQRTDHGASHGPKGHTLTKS